MKKQFTVTAGDERLDLTLSQAFVGLSRAQAKLLVAARGVRVDGKIVRGAGQRVNAGDAIEVDLDTLDARTAEARAALAAKENDLVVLAQGLGWAAVRKPAGLPSVAGFFGDRLHFAAMACARTGGDATLPDFGLLHRLDNDTSGTCLIARDVERYTELHAARDAGALPRTYWAIVRGVPQTSTVQTPIAHHPSDNARMLVVTGDVAHRGKPQPARSDLTVLGATADRALIAVKIQGGRRHQIRVHLASVGHPVLGDQLYGDFSSLPDSPSWPRRFALHAMALDFVPPNASAAHIISEPGDHFWAFAPELRRAIA